MASIDLVWVTELFPAYSLFWLFWFSFQLLFLTLLYRYFGIYFLLPFSPVGDFALGLLLVGDYFGVCDIGGILGEVLNSVSFSAQSRRRDTSYTYIYEPGSILIIMCHLFSA